MATNTVSVGKRPDSVKPGKERAAEHARRLVQRGLSRGMRLQPVARKPLLPPDSKTKAPTKATKQLPVAPEGKKTPETPPTPSPVFDIQIGRSYRCKNQVVTPICYLAGIVLLAETKDLDQGAGTWAIRDKAFTKKFKIIQTSKPKSKKKKSKKK